MNVYVRQEEGVQVKSKQKGTLRKYLIPGVENFYSLQYEDNS